MHRWTPYLLPLLLWLSPLAGYTQAPVLYGDSIQLEEDIEIDLDDDSITIEPLPAGADAALTEAEIDLGSIEVLGNRTLTALLDDARAVTVIDALDFGGAISAADVLERVPGVDVRLSGGLGQLSTVQVRGARAKQVLVLIDGQPVAADTADLSLIPLSNLARIEVVRGPAAARFGPGALGGVVNLVTNQPQSKPQPVSNETTLPLNEHRDLLWPPVGAAEDLSSASLALTGGGYSALGAEYSAERPGESYFISHLQARNNYSYERSGGDTATRRNNDISRQTFWGAWDDGRLRHRLGFTHLKRGVPGGAEFPTLQAQLSQDNLWWQTTGDGWRGDFALSQTDFRDPQPVLNRGPIDTSTTQAHLEFGWGSVAGQPVSWGVKPRFDYSNSDDSGPHTRSGLDLHHYWRDVAGRLTLSADAGLVASSDVAVDPVGHLGAEYDLGQGLSAYSSAGYSVRHPSFNELYYADTGGVRGDPDLSSERLVSYELGAAWTGNRARCEVAAFYSDYRDSIIWAPVSAYTVAAINTGAAEVAGFEALTDIMVADGLWWRSALTWLPRTEYDSGVPLTGRSSRHINTRLEYQRDGWQGAFAVDHTGSIPADLFGSLMIEPRTLCGLELAHDAGSNQVSVTLSNLFDVQARDSWDYPLPGREIYVTWTTDI